ncbi:MAG: RpiB/LacA/LacB family sugar-phosphate isomerase [Candidatus Woesearchaeota archaeon]
MFGQKRGLDMKIFLGADHAGFELKEKLKGWLGTMKKYQVFDLGNTRYEPNDDYPDFAYKVAKAVAKTPGSFGILVCGSAEGICIAANKVNGVRAVAPPSVVAAKLTRKHNDANILCLAGGGLLKKVRGLGIKLAKAKRIVSAWLSTPFSEEPRHVRRLKKISEIEEKEKVGKWKK